MKVGMDREEVVRARVIARFRQRKPSRFCIADFLLEKDRLNMGGSGRSRGIHRCHGSSIHK